MKAGRLASEKLAPANPACASFAPSRIKPENVKFCEKLKPVAFSESARLVRSHSSNALRLSR